MLAPTTALRTLLWRTLKRPLPVVRSRRPAGSLYEGSALENVDYRWHTIRLPSQHLAWKSPIVFAIGLITYGKGAEGRLLSVTIGSR
jgi:hypothetical protein